MIQQKKMIALIPARSGSKRILHKNIIPFFGHPMIAYTVTAAINSGLFSKVIVSTDDPFIGEIGEWYGAEYLPRPSELASDQASLVDVALHVLESLNSSNYEALCQLMPNCPLRRSSDIINHFKTFQQERRSFQISVVPYRCVYPHWALVSDETGTGNWLFGRENLTPSQQFKHVYCPTGAIWWVRVDDFISQRAFYGNPFYMAPIDANRGIDIDCMDELDLADLIVRGYKDREGQSPLEPVEVKPFPVDH